MSILVQRFHYFVLGSAGIGRRFPASFQQELPKVAGRRKDCCPIGSQTRYGRPKTAYVAILSSGMGLLEYLVNSQSVELVVEARLSRAKKEYNFVPMVLRSSLCSGEEAGNDDCDCGASEVNTWATLLKMAACSLGDERRDMSHQAHRRVSFFNTMASNTPDGALLDICAKA